MVKGSPHAEVVNVLDCEIVVSEFEPQSCYYVHFRTNTRRKGKNPLIPAATSLIATRLFFTDMLALLFNRYTSLSFFVLISVVLLFYLFIYGGRGVISSNFTLALVVAVVVFALFVFISFFFFSNIRSAEVIKILMGWHEELAGYRSVWPLLILAIFFVFPAFWRLRRDEKMEGNQKGINTECHTTEELLNNIWMSLWIQHCPLKLFFFFLYFFAPVVLIVWGFFFFFFFFFFCYCF